jgi:hypothetical protein
VYCAVTKGCALFFLNRLERPANISLYGLGSYRTAWLMCHKVRTALMQDIDKLGGIVEVDETFVGGLAKNRHWDKRGGGGGTGGIGSGKTPIVGAVSRKGNVVARVVANVTSETLTAFVREAVSHKVDLPLRYSSTRS